MTESRKMSTQSGSARWRCCATIFFAMTSLIPRCLADSVSEQTTFNAALNQRVTVTPRDATCHNGDTVTYSSSRSTRCLSGCRSGHNFSTQARPEARFPPDVYEMGGGKCHVPENSYDKLLPVMCYMFFKVRYNEYFTYSVWVKPAETHTEQSLIATNGIQIMIRNGHLEGYVYLTGQHLPNTTTLTTIGRGVWTHIALRIQPLADETLRLEVFVNGISVASTMMFQLGHVTGYSEPLDTRRPTRYRDPPRRLPIEATPRPGSGPRPTARNVYIGVAQMQIELVGCEILEISVCAKIGYSAAVRMPNSLGYRKQSEAYRKAKVDFLLEIDADEDVRWNKDLVAMFACAYYFPPCSPNGTALLPCRSLCKGVMDTWPESVKRPYIDCEAFPNSTDPTVCVGLSYKPDFGLYEGDVRHGLFHNRILTNREIEAEYIGRLRHVRPLSECLCKAPYGFTALMANSSLTCVTDVPDQHGITATSARLATPGYGRESHFVPEFVNDGNSSTAWASGTSHSRDTVDIQVDFASPVQMWVVEIRLDSHFPRRGITVRGRRSGRWQLMQYLATDCVRTWGKVNGGVLAQPDSVNCQNVSRLSGGVSTPPYTVTLDFREGRPRYYVPSAARRRRRDADDTVSIEEFLTTSAIRVTFRGKPPKGNNHVVAELSVFPRNRCGCYPDGTKQGFHCLDGVCQCRDVAAVNIIVAGPKCRPYLTRMFPSFGPRSGGTKVIIFGGFLGRENTSVSVRTWIEDIAFDIEYSNETSIYSVTTSLTDATGRRDIMNVPTQLRVTLESGYELRTQTNFVYREDPIVERIEPRQSIVSGGIVQTIIGRHMDSVAVPMMNVTLVYRGRHYEQPKSVCTIRNSTAILCPTPDIQLPLEVNGLIKKSHITERDRDSVASHDARARREANSINSDEMKFYIGLLLDGVPTYRNVSDTLPEYGKLDMFNDPKVFEFKDEVLLFRPYSPHNDQHVVIKGERLDLGCSAGDYEVTVGGGDCVVLELRTNQLVCRPPETKPDLGTYHKDGAPRVKVEVGNINVVVGYLRYEESLTASTAFR
ncbi:hypothetical protein LSAT2_015310 [Lamellibrachia satsuma]|nr:hypothetical protein LSAT2_015310 [Lamellibrachia satsuma]